MLSWPREMIDSLENQKKLVWNDSKKMFLMKIKISPKQKKT